MRSQTQFLWLCLLGGCALDSTPALDGDQAHPRSSSAMWSPQPLERDPDASMIRSSDAGAQAPAAAQPIAAAASPTRSASAGSDSPAPDSSPPAAAAIASAGAPAPAPAVETKTPQQPAAAGAPATTSPLDAGMQPAAPPPPAAMPPQAGGGAMMPPSPTQRDAAMPEMPMDRTGGSMRLVDAVTAIFNERTRAPGKSGSDNEDGNEGDGKKAGETASKDELKDWQKQAQRTPQLSAALAQSVLTTLQQQGVCSAGADACQAACQAIASDCTQCAAVAECASRLTQLCGGLPAGCATTP